MRTRALMKSSAMTPSSTMVWFHTVVMSALRVVKAWNSALER